VRQQRKTKEGWMRSSKKKGSEWAYYIAAQPHAVFAARKAHFQKGIFIYGKRYNIFLSMYCDLIVVSDTHPSS